MICKRTGARQNMITEHESQEARKWKKITMWLSVVMAGFGLSSFLFGNLVIDNVGQVSRCLDFGGCSSSLTDQFLTIAWNSGSALNSLGLAGIFGSLGVFALMLKDVTPEPRKAKIQAYTLISGLIILVPAFGVLFWEYFHQVLIPFPLIVAVLVGSLLIGFGIPRRTYMVLGTHTSRRV
jgi:hypothetical protein